MSMRTWVASWFVLTTLSAGAFGQDQSSKKNDPPRFILPFSQNFQQQQNRTRTRQQTTPPSQAGRSSPNQVRPEDIQRFIEGFLPEADSDNRYSDDYRNQSRQGAPAAPRRAVAAPDQFAALTVDQQRRLLQLALVSLEEDLNGLSSGNGWTKYLHLRSLLRLIALQKSEMPDEDARLRLKTIADQYDAVQANSRYRRISGLWGFQTLQIGLREYAAEPIQRDARGVRVNSRQLRRSLEGVQRGDGWIGYFELDEMDKLAQSTEKLSPATGDKLREMIVRLDQVSKNPAYGTISSMRGFDATHRSLKRLADRFQHFADIESLDDARDMKRIVQTIRRNLDAIQKASGEEDRAQQALGSVQLGTPPAEKAQKTLELIKQRHDEELKQAQDGLETLLAAIKEQSKRDQAMQTISLASRKPGLEIIKKLQAYDKTDSAMGFKVLRTKDNANALATQTLTLADRDRVQEMIKRLKAYEQKDCAKRVKLLNPKDKRIARANETEQLTDRERVLEIIKKLFEETQGDEEIILMQFSDVPEPEMVTVMQFEDVLEPEVTLLQFDDVAEPEVVTLMQFSDVTEPDEDSEEEGEDATGHSE